MDKLTVINLSCHPEKLFVPFFFCLLVVPAYAYYQITKFDREATKLEE
jgi:hypothetical protein